MRRITTRCGVCARSFCARPWWIPATRACCLQLLRVSFFRSHQTCVKALKVLLLSATRWRAEMQVADGVIGRLINAGKSAASKRFQTQMPGAPLQSQAVRSVSATIGTRPVQVGSPIRKSLGMVLLSEGRKFRGGLGGAGVIACRPCSACGGLCASRSLRAVSAAARFARPAEG